MKHNLIKTEDYLLVVSDEQINFGDYFITDDGRIELSAPDWKAREWHRKIIVHLPLNNSPILEGVDLLPPLLPQGEDVDELSENSVEDVKASHPDFHLRDVYKEFFKEGYEKAFKLRLTSNTRGSRGSGTHPRNRK